VPFNRYKRKEPITQADRSYNTRNDRDVQLEWVDKITQNDPGKYTEWEIEFIESVETQLKGGRELSTKQSEILERIYNKY